jgi:hypothetical protein
LSRAIGLWNGERLLPLPLLLLLLLLLAGACRSHRHRHSLLLLLRHWRLQLVGPHSFRRW